MSMTKEQFAQTVKRLEAEAGRHPRRYQVRVALLACLGYAFLISVLAALLAITGLLAAVIVLGHGNVLVIKLAIPLLMLAGAILKSLRVEVTKPEGLEMRREDVPWLFSILDDVRVALKGPRIDHVLLNDEFNAGIVQIPRLGLLGWHSNYLILGLPLMQALTPDQFRSVLAHEIGHLSGNHGRFSGWIYRQRLTWSQLLDNLHRGKHRAGKSWFRRFLDWYAPYFNAYTFVLARRNEYAADQCAAQVAGAPTAAGALVAIRLKRGFLNETFWPEIFQRATEQPQPPSVFADMLHSLRQLPETAEARRYFHLALQETTGTADTHPSLPDRLNALGFPVSAECGIPSGLLPVSDATAAFSLGPGLDRYVSLLERDWRVHIGPRWEKEHKRAQQARQRLAALEEKSQSEPLTPEEAWERAGWTAEYGDARTAAALFEQITQDQPHSAPAFYALGKTLLAADDETGLRHLDHAMALDASCILNACALAFNFLKGRGRLDAAEVYREQGQRRNELMSNAQEERAEVTGNETFLLHGMPDAEQEALVKQLAAIPQIQTAFLVRKAVKNLPEHPQYVLWVTARYGFRLSSQAVRQELLQRLAREVRCSSELWFLVVDKTDTRLLKVQYKIKGTQIFRR